VTSGMTKRLATIEILVQGSSAASHPANGMLVSEHRMLADSARVSSPRRELLQVLHTARLLEAFLGSIVALRQGTHLGMDSVISRLPHRGKVACFVVSHLLMLWCCVLMWQGSWPQTVLNLDNRAPVAGLPVAVLVFLCRNREHIGRGEKFAVALGPLFEVRARLLLLFLLKSKTHYW